MFILPFSFSTSSLYPSFIPLLVHYFPSSFLFLFHSIPLTSSLLPSPLHWTQCLSLWYHTLCRTIHYTVQNSVLKRERNEALKNTENYTSKLQDTERELNSLKAFSQRSLEDLQISRDELAGEWSLESTVQDLQFLHCTYSDLSRNSRVAYINTINCSFVSIIL